MLRLMEEMFLAFEYGFLELNEISIILELVKYITHKY